MVLLQGLKILNCCFLSLNPFLVFFLVSFSPCSEERLVFMTTNHMDRLDKALLRPGRIDYVQYIGDATDYQVTNSFFLYPDCELS
jgi:hypothetical protein